MHILLAVLLKGHVHGAFEQVQGQGTAHHHIIDQEVGGAFHAQLLRVLLDEKRAAWDEAVDTVSRCFELRIPEVRPGAPVPLAAVRALQPRDAELIGVLNEKLCSRLWDAWPGDWLRIGESAIVRDDEADLTMLAAAMCLRIYCTKEELAGSLRALYTLDPARFTEL